MSRVASDAGEGFVRLFAALPLPDDVVERLSAVQRALEGQWPPRAVHWARRDQIHLTLRFYGNVAVTDIPALTEALRSACAGAGPMRLQLGRLAAFPDARRPRVLWAAVDGGLAGLGRLHQRIAAASGAFGDHRETRAFQPHLTLGRVAVERGRQLPLPSSSAWVDTECEGPGWTATGVHLIRSQLGPAGACYSTLSALALTGAAPGPTDRPGGGVSADQ